jgi:hypothetical protein
MAGLMRIGSGDQQRVVINKSLRRCGTRDRCRTELSTVHAPDFSLPAKHMGLPHSARLSLAKNVEEFVNALRVAE